MDSLTHTVLGACIGEVIAGKKLGKKAMLLGAIANNFPDIDVISNIWTKPAEALLAHRGITHSLLAAFIFSFLFAWLFFKKSKHRDVSFKEWIMLFGINIFTHLLIDAFTSYGTGWFEPFSHYRVSFNSMFILDPFFLIPVLACAIMLLILKKNSLKRHKIALAGICIGSIYSTATLINKLYVNNVAKQNLLAQNIKYSDYMITPTPLNNFLWYMAVNSDSVLHLGFYSIFDKDRNIRFQTINKNTNALEPYKNSEEVKKLLRFSKEYYTISNDENFPSFNDARFGQVGGWDDKNAPFVFRFNLIEHSGNETTLQQGRFKAIQGDELKKLIKRIKGTE